jgi:hypothetical protein
MMNKRRNTPILEGFITPNIEWPEYADHALAQFRRSSGGSRTGANLIHSQRNRRQRLEPATSSPCLATGIPLLLHG